MVWLATHFNKKLIDIIAVKNATKIATKAFIVTSKLPLLKISISGIVEDISMVGIERSIENLVASKREVL